MGTLLKWLSVVPGLSHPDRHRVSVFCICCDGFPLQKHRCRSVNFLCLCIGLLVYWSVCFLTTCLSLSVDKCHGSLVYMITRSQMFSFWKLLPKSCFSSLLIPQGWIVRHAGWVGDGSVFTEFLWDWGYYCRGWHLQLAAVQHRGAIRSRVGHFIQKHCTVFPTKFHQRVSAFLLLFCLSLFADVHSQWHLTILDSQLQTPSLAFLWNDSSPALLKNTNTSVIVKYRADIPQNAEKKLTHRR